VSVVSVSISGYVGDDTDDRPQLPVVWMTRALQTHALADSKARLRDHALVDARGSWKGSASTFQFASSHVVRPSHQNHCDSLS
jgi:hypothetical protein